MSVPFPFSIADAMKQLAQVQASNVMVICTYQYDFPAVSKEQSPEAVEQVAIQKFQEKRPGYNVKNMCTLQLTKNVLQCVQKQKGQTKISIPNGCCNVAACPTKCFCECVLESL
jgi:hypothetical protein